MSKKVIKQKVTLDFCFEEYDGLSLDALVETLVNITYSNKEQVMIKGIGSYDDYRLRLVKTIEREETDKEYNARLKREEKSRKAKADKEERERKEFERLKVKFGEI